MKYLFDTMALIAFFNNETGAGNVESILEKVDENSAEGFVSVITLTEIYYLYSKRLGEKHAKKRIEQIGFSNLMIVSIDEETAIKAGEFKTKTIPIADALIAANAYFTGAKVVTDDEDFKKTNIEIVKFR